MVEERLPVESANRGWNRASIVFWSRKPYSPRVRREDLALPTHLAGLRLLASCLAPAFCLTAFAVWTPLFFVTIFTGLSMTRVRRDHGRRVRRRDLRALRLGLESG